MPQLDNPNFIVHYTCFVVCFLLTVAFMAIIILPTLYRHQKVKEFYLQETLALNKIAQLEAKMLSANLEKKLLSVVREYAKK